jgi:hypothetical protein
MPSLLVEVDGRSWPAILASSSRRRGLILLASRLVVAGHPRPHSVTAGRGRERIYKPIGLWVCVHFYIQYLHTQFYAICTVPGSDLAFGDLPTSPKRRILK